MKRIFTLLTAITCTLAANSQIYFEDDFQGAALTTNNAWTIQSVSNPDMVPEWDIATFGSDGFAKVSTWDGSAAHDLNSWLISPSFDLSAATVVDFSFDNVLRYGAGTGGNNIIVHISNDYDGTSNPTMQGTWTDITSLFTLDTDQNSWTFIASGVGNISTYISATTFIAFEFVSTVADAPTWEIDNVLIQENGTVPPAPTLTSIYDIQYTTDALGDSPEKDNIVTTRGVVTGVVQFGTNLGRFFIQDGDGAWNGIYVYENGTAVSIGDSVFVTGTVLEYFGLTEMGSVTDITIINSGNALPNPIIVDGSTVSNEEFEGVLVTFESGINTIVTDQYGAWTINNNGTVKVDDDLMAASFTSTVGNAYDVTGVRHFAFDEVLVLPRDMADIVTVGFNSVLENSINANIFPNPTNGNVTISGVNGNVSITSINGAVVYNGEINGTLNVNLENLTTGLYMVEVIENNTKANYKLMVK